MPTAIVESWKYTIVDLSADETIVLDRTAILGAIWFRTGNSAQAVPIRDGSGGEILVSLPASQSANAAFEYFKGTEFRTALVVDPDNAATGEIIVQWRAG